MSEITIRVDGVSKKFCRSLKRSMMYGAIDATRAALRLSGNEVKLRLNEFWAVRDVTFELKRGEALGLIGANGSGKSTLLRLLCGIFPIDTGRVEINGRLGSLIAVGAGFHPHMSGRENVFLNGILLGMSRREIAQRFDRIVEFAEIGHFLDAPVSTYSSGMRVRLGFAIAVHIEPDVLLVDEVMSVGDTAFRRKAAHAMENLLHKSGTTLILVSHNNFTIREHCSTALLLNQGAPQFFGDVEEALSLYDEEQRAAPEPLVNEGIAHFRIGSAKGEDILSSDGDFWMELALMPEFASELKLPITLYLKDQDGSRLAAFSTSKRALPAREMPHRFAGHLPPFAQGVYYVDLKIGSEFHGSHTLINHRTRIDGHPSQHKCAVSLPLT